MRRSDPTPRTQAPGARRIEIAGIEVELVLKRVKRMSLRVYPPDGRVRLTAPRGTPADAVEAAVAARAAWIRDHQERFRSLPQPEATLFVTGETHYVDGRPHRLELVLGEGGRAHLDGGRLILPAAADSDRSAREKRLEEWYRRRLQAALPPLVSEWSARVGVAEPEHRVKRMRTRWGSCNPRARRIWLNLALARRRPELLEYVVVHEVAHLLVADHGPRFQALMTRHLPHWRELDAELDAWPIWARLPAARPD